MTRTQELVMMITFLVLGCALTMAETAALEHAHHYECTHTRYPSLCDETLKELMSSGNDKNVDIILALVNKTISETNLPRSYFASFETQDNAQQDKSSSSVGGYCQELMDMSMKRLDQSMEALSKPTRNKEDIQTWLSASLTFQQTCNDFARSQTSTGVATAVVDTISKKMDYLSALASNSLALVNQITATTTTTTTTKRKEKESKEEFPEWISSKARKLLQGAAPIEANAVVAQDGSGNYKTISEAIAAATGGRFVIYVKAGTYKEKIRTSKNGITLIGAGKYSTVIVGSESVKGGASLPDTATFTIMGDGFIAKDIGFHNNAGPQGEQAVALYIASDRSVLFRCSIAGYQDTIYAHSLRQFYRECDIYGTIDFIFGNAAAVFQTCNIMLRRPLHGGSNAVLANGRTDPGQNTGFSLHKCAITPSSDLSPVKHSVKSYLGRPWKEYSRAVVIGCTIDDAIAQQGWVEWPGYGSSVLRTLYFGEYGNSGPGAGTARRVQWPGFHVMGNVEASKFTVGNFIAGSSWIPSSVGFISGL
ncbi:probable pectinesterase/pectinesterase inhibitor 54 [Arachis hypogaea]|uniref:Pectinesterase n=1 Tax=Arachis hypogaea TaxID=3818 RepID=A0A445DVV0_ARAHY|nr:pectinesterase [Arachis hypogaea]QHO57638.1 putative pectinesterase/pectinesterase inhibitor [Arachis hypogaea]RYR67296.1 hypothetical protein Ahy_A03g013621 [Arachis hypogaea]